MGSVGKDPEVRTTQDGTKIVNLVLATSESWKDRFRRAQKACGSGPGRGLQ
jgi:single-stranded DNA-binding protein